MVWRIEYTETARRALGKLDRSTAHKIIDYLDQRVAMADDPTAFGHALTANETGRWRYRVGDYRVVCEIEKQVLVVYVVKIGHRSEVYRR